MSETQFEKMAKANQKLQAEIERLRAEIDTAEHVDGIRIQNRRKR